MATGIYAFIGAVGYVMFGDSVSEEVGDLKHLSPNDFDAILHSFFYRSVSTCSQLLATAKL